MKVLILGLTGMLGHQIYTKFKRSGFFSSVKGTIRKRKNILKNYPFFDINDVYDNVDFYNGFNLLNSIIDEYKPEIIINCVVVKKSSDEKDFWQINSLLPHIIARIIPKGSKLIQISTNGVFSGKKGNYSENDKPEPTGIYSISKFFGEVTYDNHLTIRTSFFGRELFNRESGLVEWFLKNKDSRVNGFSNSFFSAVSTNCLAEVLIDLIKKNVSGIINICSERVNKYEFLKVLNKIYQRQKEILKSDNSFTDLSLSPSKMKEIGINLPGFDSMIKQMKEEDIYEN